MKAELRAVGTALGVMIFLSGPASADGWCGPGKHIAPNPSDWRCLPGDGSRVKRSAPNNTGSQIAAGLALGGALFSIIESLASQSQMTDNLGRVDLDRQRHGTMSRTHNRQGLSLQQAGKFNEARIAFLKASDEAVKAGNLREAKINEKNAEIADALHWLRKGYEAEKAGQATRANVAYRMGIDAARRADNKGLASKLSKANDSLIKNKKKKGMISSDKESCTYLNGKYACY